MSSLPRIRENCQIYSSVHLKTTFTGLWSVTQEPLFCQGLTFFYSRSSSYVVDSSMIHRMCPFWHDVGLQRLFHCTEDNQRASPQPMTCRRSAQSVGLDSYSQALSLQIKNKKKKLCFPLTPLPSYQAGNLIGISDEYVGAACSFGLFPCLDLTLSVFPLPSFFPPSSSPLLQSSPPDKTTRSFSRPLDFRVVWTRRPRVHLAMSDRLEG